MRACSAAECIDFCELAHPRSRGSCNSCTVTSCPDAHTLLVCPSLAGLVLVPSRLSRAASGLISMSRLQPTASTPPLQDNKSVHHVNLEQHLSMLTVELAVSQATGDIWRIAESICILLT